jgi:hypothetical protein
LDTLEPLGNEFGAAGVRCFVSACNDTLPQCRARLEAAHGQRVKPRMDVLDELAGVGQDGQPVVLSASQLLHIAKYKDLYCLRRSLMTDTGLPVAMLAPHPTSPPPLCRWRRAGGWQRRPPPPPQPLPQPLPPRARHRPHPSPPLRPLPLQPLPAAMSSPQRAVLSPLPPAPHVPLDWHSRTAHLRR